LTLEQRIIADNAGRNDLLIIDRQVTDSEAPGRLDLLGLEQKEGKKYSFLVLEVKRGDNDDIGHDSVKQLQKYVSHIKNNSDDYKKCYEKNFKQQYELGLFDWLNNGKIEITPEVGGKIVVAGYSVLGKNKIKKLKKGYPDVDIEQLRYEISL